MINRQKYLQDLVNFKDKKLIKVIIGIRRCGKSTMFALYQEYLIQHGITAKQIINVNLEEGTYRKIRKAEDLYDYIGKVGGAEVDFVAVGPQGEEYYQVAQSVKNENTLHREISALDSIKDHNQKILLTMDYAPLTSYNGIKQINVLEWLVN
jgi:predicted AAA+ superfamily ATPase